MRALTKGHLYELQSFEDDGLVQFIQFIEKVPVYSGSAELRTVNNGTTNEEILAMLIDRMKYLQDKFPCAENKAVIKNLETSKAILEQRTADRKARNVEGKALA